MAIRQVTQRWCTYCGREGHLAHACPRRLVFAIRENRNVNGDNGLAAFAESLLLNTKG